MEINWPIFVKENKYTKWYYQLVENVQNRILPEETYIERHHIIPVSLGGSNKKENIVILTAREHYIAHALLWKMTMDLKHHNKMSMALHVMVNGSGNKKQHRTYLINSKVYENNRKEYSKIQSEKMAGEGNSFFGKKHTEESLTKIKEANARTKEIRSAKATGVNNPRFGKKNSKEMCEQISKSLKAVWEADPELKLQQSARAKEKWQDPEWKKEVLESRHNSEGWKNRDWKAIGRKSADVKMASGWKPTEESKRKLSQTRLAKFATGEIVPWNKGKKVGCFRSEESLKASAKKAHETRKANGNQVRLVGDKNPFYGKTHSEETKAKIAATKAAKRKMLDEQDNTSQG